MDLDKWSTLPEVLLVDIFRRLEVTALVRCARVCRPWRRTIIDKARCLRPRPDRFLPDLLLGFFDRYENGRLQYLPASNTAVPHLTPATTGISVEGSLYNYLMSSRDGFLLFGDDKDDGNLCLWTAQTGICRVLPPAAFESFESYPTVCKYVLVTSYDVSDDSDETAVWILALEWQHDAKDGTTYQIFSSKTGEWGPVKRSAKLPEDLAAHVVNVARDCIVCRGAVSWLVGLVSDHNICNRTAQLCIFSMDLITGRTWTTEVPPLTGAGKVFLAVSEDGWLSLVRMLSSSHQIEVWVLVGDVGQWTLRRTIDDVEKLLPNCRSLQLSGFCPRSGYLFGTCTDNWDFPHDFLIGIDGSSPRLIERVEDTSSSAIRFPYEMDCSTYMSSYISKMKYF